MKRRDYVAAVRDSFDKPSPRVRGSVDNPSDNGDFGASTSNEIFKTPPGVSLTSGGSGAVSHRGRLRWNLAASKIHSAIC